MNDILKKFKKTFAEAFTSEGSSSNILERDKTGNCIGECRDRVREGELERQRDINLSGVEDIESFPSVKGAYARHEAPGVWGGHV